MYEVECNNGVCKEHTSFLDECLDCDIVKQIEHDLLREMLSE